MTELLGEFRGQPILRIDKMDSTHSFVYDCPACGEDHLHGEEHDIAYHQLSHRVAHCDSHGDGYEGYYLVADGETEGWEV